jgi:hypothetical protein
VDGGRASDDNSYYGIVGLSLALFFFPTDLTGIDLARLADLPSDVLVEGRRVAERLAALQSSHEEASESSKVAMRRKALLRVIPFCHFLLGLHLLDSLGRCCMTSSLWALLPSRLGYVIVLIEI